MLIEFDSEKRVQTLADRGLDFADAPLVMSGDQLTMLDTRIDYGKHDLLRLVLLRASWSWWSGHRAARVVVLFQ